MPSPGQRVVLRYRLPTGASHPMTDVLGILRSLDPVVVQAANGRLTTVDPERVVALKVIPPRPVRTSAIRNLEHAAACAWPGLEHQWLGGWLLRAGAGFTHRANSVAPLGPPGSDDALERVHQWYAERGLPARFQLPDRMSVDLPDWGLSDEVVVLTADAATIAGPPVTVTDSLDEEWATGCHSDGAVLTGEARAVLSAVLGGHLGFGRIADNVGVQAVARGAVTVAPDGTRWVGLSAVEVALSQRRRGFGARICAAMAAWGLEHDAQSAYVQVAADNDPALRLYAHLGFTPHHRYRYATEA